MTRGVYSRNEIGLTFKNQSMKFTNLPNPKGGKRKNNNHIDSDKESDKIKIKYPFMVESSACQEFEEAHST